MALGVVVRALGELRVHCERAGDEGDEGSDVSLGLAGADRAAERDEVRKLDAQMHEWLRMRGSSVKGARRVLAMSVSSSSPSASRKSSCALVGACPPPRNC